MNSPRMYDVAKPRIINQKWAVHDPATYSQFGFEDHNGRDLALPQSKKLYSPFDGTIVRKGFQPNGGGVFLGIISEPFDFPQFTCTTPDGRIFSYSAGSFRILTDLLHLESISVNEGDKIKAGDLLCIGDNTGFSTGPHCHQQDRRVLWDGKTITTVDVNTANNTFDPTQFLTGIYAEDIQRILPLYQTLINTLTRLLQAERSRLNNQST